MENTAEIEKLVADEFSKLLKEMEEEDTILAPGLMPGGDTLDGHKLSGELKLDDRVC